MPTVKPFVIAVSLSLVAGLAWGQARPGGGGGAGGPAANTSAPVVVSSTGEVIGRLIPGIYYTAAVLTTFNGQPLALEIQKDAWVTLHNIYYTSANCSGQAYTRDISSWTTQRGTVAQTSPGVYAAFVITSGPQTVTFQSQRNSDSTCDVISATESLYPVTSGPVGSPPFTIR